AIPRQNDGSDAVLLARGTFWRARLRLMLVRSAAAVLLLAAATGAANAGSGVVTARYALTLSGLPVGTATLTATVHGDSYRINASAKIGGLLALLSDGRGAGAASGRLAGFRPQATGYALNTVSSDKQQTVQMAMSNGAVTDVDLAPELPFRPDRIP